MLYVKTTNAVYGITKASIPFYKKFFGDQTTIGFKPNPYNPCVSKKVVNGRNIFVVWHANGLKVSHESKNFFPGCPSG